MAFSVRGKYILLSILLILASINFTRTAYDILKSSKRLDDLEEEVSGLDSRKQRLQQEIERKKTPEYVEEKARNELNMIKPGEKIVVFVNDALGKTSSAPSYETASSNVLSATDTVATKKSPNLLQWYRLFFDK
ncbi:septum formation initiator family protein [candidate division WWE3 bacterium]|uniref:Septum formation initiator family protein n=1 Tax=candidate division WWE3 bacterium TaxID=2053526 RepID=A0A7X9DKF6_UNCKA|nr:septum formation initiator family protein [candidate division WWE3 bacterium]